MSRLLDIARAYQPPPVKTEEALLTDNRADFARICGLIERLRCESPPIGRPEALARVRRQIDKLAARCDIIGDDGQGVGFTDPSDEFGDGDQLSLLRADFAELTAYGNPYPLGPLGDDPFPQGRRFNGRPLGAVAQAPGTEAGEPLGTG